MAYIKSYGMRKQAMVGKGKFIGFLKKLQQQGYDTDGLLRRLVNIRKDVRSNVHQLDQYDNYMGKRKNRIIQWFRSKLGKQPRVAPPPADWKNTVANDQFRYIYNKAKNSYKHHKLRDAIKYGGITAAGATGLGAGGYGIYKAVAGQPQEQAQ